MAFSHEHIAKHAGIPSSKSINCVHLSIDYSLPSVYHALRGAVLPNWPRGKSFMLDGLLVPSQQSINIVGLPFWDPLTILWGIKFEDGFWYLGALSLKWAPTHFIKWWGTAARRPFPKWPPREHYIFQISTCFTHRIAQGVYSWIFNGLKSTCHSYNTHRHLEILNLFVGVSKDAIKQNGHDGNTTFHILAQIFIAS